MAATLCVRRRKWWQTVAVLTHLIPHEPAALLGVVAEVAHDAVQDAADVDARQVLLRAGGGGAERGQ